MVRVLIDIDSTIADWGKAYDDALDAYDAEVPEEPSNIPRTKDQVAFNLKLGLSPWQCIVVDEIMDKPGFYRTLPEIPGAIDALVEIQAADEYDVFLVTSPWHTNPTCSQDKLDWVREHLGEAWVDKVIITKDKTLIDGDYLIDDKPEITGAATPRWQHIIFDQPYNQHIEDKERLVYWESVLEVLDALESEKPNANVVAAFKKLNKERSDILEGASTVISDKWVKGQEIRSVSSTGAEKGVKDARFDLLPIDALTQVAEHYGFGARKYADNQYRAGYEWSKSYAALQRHATQFWGGEDFDEETGSNHMAAVAWHALTLMTFYKEHPEFDDRFKKEGE